MIKNNISLLDFTKRVLKVQIFQYFHVLKSTISTFDSIKRTSDIKKKDRLTTQGC